MRRSITVTSASCVRARPMSSRSPAERGSRPPAHPDLDQLRRQAKDLLRAAQAGDTAATAGVRAVFEELTLGARSSRWLPSRVRELACFEARGRRTDARRRQEERQQQHPSSCPAARSDTRTRRLQLRNRRPTRRRRPRARRAAAGLGPRNTSRRARGLGRTRRRLLLVDHQIGPSEQKCLPRRAAAPPGRRGSEGSYPWAPARPRRLEAAALRDRSLKRAARAAAGR
jgi:hypothetical protein